MTSRMYSVHGLEDLSHKNFPEEILRQYIFQSVFFYNIKYNRGNIHYIEHKKGDTDIQDIEYNRGDIQNIEHNRGAIQNHRVVV